jgi:hypothetical protein
VARIESSETHRLNAICPYFTMFPLAFPWRVLNRLAGPKDIVFDPFCGRGTTNFAARLLGLHTIGLDSNPVAIATTKAKLAQPPCAASIVGEAKDLLSARRSYSVPQSKFWKMAYRPSVLDAICKLRAGLLEDCRSSTRKALRGLLLGALHGPLRVDGSSSYFSNQSTRTYAPKPKYAVSYWRETGFRAPRVDVLKLIEARAARYFSEIPKSVAHAVRLGDSRCCSQLERLCAGYKPKIIITSPPYYGMRTYVADQWLRNWFLGGEDHVDYSYGVQVSHRGLDDFVDDLRSVWLNVAYVSHKDAQLVFRFGAINDRLTDPREIIFRSLQDTPWSLVTIVDAGTSRNGKRQADIFEPDAKKPIRELDAWAVRH